MQRPIYRHVQRGVVILVRIILLAKIHLIQVLVNGQTHPNCSNYIQLFFFDALRTSE